MYVIYHYREHQGRYGTQQHRDVTTAEHHSQDGHDDGEDEAMTTNWLAVWCINSLYLQSGRLLLDNHYIGIRLQERRGRCCECNTSQQLPI